MSREKIKEFTIALIDRGHKVSAIRSSYLQMPLSDEEIDKILDFFRKNPEATNADDNWEIHKVYLKQRGIYL